MFLSGRLLEWKMDWNCSWLYPFVGFCCLNSGVCCIRGPRSCHSSGGYYYAVGQSVTFSEQSASNLWWKHRNCNMFLSHVFSCPLSVSYHQCPKLIQPLSATGSTYLNQRILILNTALTFISSLHRKDDVLINCQIRMIKGKQSHYRPGVAEWVPGSLGC